MLVGQAEDLKTSNNRAWKEVEADAVPFLAIIFGQERCSSIDVGTC